MFNFLAKLLGNKGPSLEELLANGAIVIDVRSPNEYRSGHVQKSRNIPLNSLNSKKIQSLKKENKIIITCCASGMRSGRAAKLFKKDGLDAYNGGPWQSVERARLKK